MALISGATALIILPAILALLGSRVNALSLGRWREAAERTARGEKSGFWYRLSRWVMRRPGRIAALTTVLLVVVALPFLSVRFTGVDAGVLPESASARQVADTLEEDFPPAPTSPIFLAI